MQRMKRSCCPWLVFSVNVPALTVLCCVAWSCCGAQDLALEKKALNQTADRIISHVGGGGWHEERDRRSVTASTFVDHGTASFTHKHFNQTGSHWTLDNTTTSDANARGQRRDLRSQVSLGNDKCERTHCTHSRQRCTAIALLEQ